MRIMIPYEESMTPIIYAAWKADGWQPMLFNRQSFLMIKSHRHRLSQYTGDLIWSRLVVVVVARDFLYICACSKHACLVVDCIQNILLN